MKIIHLPFAAVILGSVFLFAIAKPQVVRAQVAPGPYEILPFADGFIIEAFKDLDATSGIADWTGYSGAQWISPNAYNNHTGTDTSVQTGTPLYAAAAGTVVNVVSGNPRDDHNTADELGNFVKIAIDSPGPDGELIDLYYGHMLSVSVTNGQRVEVGDLVGLSDNTGNSTSEHVHFQSEIRGGTQVCPFYTAQFKYPILFNSNGTMQVGRVIKILADSAPIRTGRFDPSPQISTAHQGQLYFASFAKRGYYQVFIPNNTSWRSGWINATRVEEIFSGTVIQPLPDNVTYTHAGQLQSKYIIRSLPDDAAAQLGQIVFGGGRFVADQITNGFYRIPLPDASATWGWVKPDNRMVVYPQLTNPSLALASLPNENFPISESFSELGKSAFGRPKFNRSVVKSFSPTSPDGDGNALFVTDQTNHGNGTSDSVLVGKPQYRNYFVQADVYFNFQPGYLANGAWERTGIFLRDDGFAGLDTTFEGAGNCYALLWDNDDGRLRAGRIVDAAITDFFSPVKTVTTAGWHRMRIEARTNEIKFFLDGVLLIQTNNNTFASGQCGLGYSWHPGSPGTYPAARGAYFDNFIADTLDTAPRFESVTAPGDGKIHFVLSGDAGSTNVIERSPDLLNWLIFTNVINASGTAEFLDSSTNASAQFYRAKRLP